MMTTQPIAFNRRGYRRREGYGLYYRSRCGLYAVYLSDQVGGVPMDPVRWLAIAYEDDRPTRVISRHRARAAAAERAVLRYSRSRKRR